MNYENETLRWPTNLDRAAIVARLIEVRKQAAAAVQALLAHGGGARAPAAPGPAPAAIG